MAQRATWRNTSGFGGKSGCADEEEYAPEVALNAIGSGPATRRHRFLPGAARIISERSRQQELPIGEHHNLHPTLGAGQVGGASDVKAQVLFDKSEEVLNRKAPKIHVTKIGE